MPTASRRRDRARHARECGSAAMERRSVHLPRRERGGRAPADRPQARLRQAGRCRGEAAGAGEGRAQGSGRIQAHRHAASAPRHRRQGRRQREVRHRHPAARNEVRGRGDLADLRRKAGRGRRSEGEGGAGCHPGRPPGRCGRGRRDSHLGGEARSRSSRLRSGMRDRTRSSRPPTSSRSWPRPSEKPGAVARHDGDAAGRDRQGRAEDRRRLRAAVPGARDDGADELHRACDEGRLRHLGRHADSRRLTQAAVMQGHRPQARAGAHPQSSARWRIRSPPRVRRHACAPCRSRSRSRVRCR